MMTSMGDEKMVKRELDVGHDHLVNSGVEADIASAVAAAEAAANAAASAAAAAVDSSDEDSNSHHNKKRNRPQDDVAIAVAIDAGQAFKRTKIEEDNNELAQVPKDTRKKKGEWSAQEDEALMLAVLNVRKKKGKDGGDIDDEDDDDWDEIAGAVAGRSAVQCLQRYMRHLSKKGGVAPAKPKETQVEPIPPKPKIEIPPVDGMQP
mmetsp:Transcript_46700/g.56537  ORF Transcript_46700/g.56537 Transcript_46700/m.56537 type:complete len:206 (-) Transcript_46700:732-1349(-)